MKTYSLYHAATNFMGTLFVDTAGKVLSVQSVERTVANGTQYDAFYTQFKEFNTQLPVYETLETIKTKAGTLSMKLHDISGIRYGNKNLFALN